MHRLSRRRVEFDRLPEQRVVDPQPVRTCGDGSLDLLVEEDVADRPAVERHENLTVSDVALARSGDEQAGGWCVRGDLVCLRVHSLLRESATLPCDSDSSRMRCARRYTRVAERSRIPADG